MNKSENITKLSVALCELLAEVKDPKKTKQGYGYKYAELQPILEMLRPLLHKYGLFIIQIPGESADKITVETIIMHKSGQWISGITGLKFSQLAKMNEPQSAGSIITYARRYSLSAMIAIAAQEDTDANIEIEDKTNFTKKNQQIETKKQLQLTQQQSNTNQQRIKPTHQEIESLKQLLSNDPDKINNILKWANINSFDEMSLDAYEKAVNGIQKKIAQGGQK
jgi:hypothetical protein